MFKQLRRFLNSVITSNPYDKIGGKPDFVKEFDDKGITSLKDMYNHIKVEKKENK